MLYTGKVKAEVKKEVFIISVPPQSNISVDDEISMEIKYDDCATTLCDQCAFNVAVLASVDETDYEHFVQDDFRVRKPDIKFDIRHVDSIIVGQPFKGTVKLKNPLPVRLTQGQFLIEGLGLGEPLKINVKEKEFHENTILVAKMHYCVFFCRKIDHGESATADFQLTPKLDGEKTISAKLNSRELEDVDGFYKITVGPNNETPD